MSGKQQLLSRNRWLGALFLLLGLSAFALIVMRVVFYEFAYDPQYYPVDYGRFNFFSYFTVQSNLYVCFYLCCLAFTFFGSDRAQRIVLHPPVKLTVTTYILVTGAVYCGGIPLGMTPPLYWDGFHPVLLSVVQIVHHMVMPPLMLLLFFLLPQSRCLEKKQLPLVGVYPLVYSVVSIVRGAVSDPQIYPYPFYPPVFFWNIFCSGKPLQQPAAYLLMLPMLLLGISVFVLIALGLSALYNLLWKKKDR
ncbi:MAG: Pr6Pr family membrane protein [Clostridia bacterium]|nr:Pr6Pr family membrane protein [Clostridia bacterium]